MKAPRVTVLMPVYNGELYLRDAINSILNQTYTDFEFLIIDDGSTDNSAKIVKSYSDIRIRLIQNGKNLGLVVSLNKGIKLSQGEYIARMDCDDVSVTRRLEKQVSFLDTNAHVSAVAAHIRFMNADGEVTGYWDNDLKTNSWSEIYSLLPKDDCIAHPTVVIRRTISLKYPYRSVQKNTTADWDLWLRMAADGNIIEKLNEVLLKYRVHFDSVTMYLNNGKVAQGRTISCKRRFLLLQISKFKINTFFFNVLYSWIRGNGRYLKLYIVPEGLRIVKRIVTSNPFKVYSDFIKLKKYLGKHNHNFIFFFPYTFIGGAERIHFEIVNCVKDKNPLVFFTGFSENNLFLRYYEENAKVFNIPYTLNYPVIAGKSKKLIADYINKRTKPVTLGSNSIFFLELIGSLSPSVYCIDIKHTFIKRTDSEEIELLPLIIRLDKRIFIGKRSMDNMLRLYHDNNIPRQLSERLIHINNFTDIPERYHAKKSDGVLNVLFVGRVSPEKRVFLFLKIAHECYKQKLPVKFQLVGNKNKIRDAKNYPFIEFKGAIIQKDEMDAVYKQAHILLITSDNEGGLPLAGMEAMANGLVLVASDVGDIPLHIKNRETGFVTSSNEEGIVAKEMVGYIKELSGNKPLMEAISERSYTYARHHFSKTGFYNSYRDLLKL